jgi:hypothetical protein
MEVQPRQMQDVENELAGLQERGAAISSAIDTAASLGLKGVDTQMRVAGFHEIANRCEAIARHIGMQAVAEGDMSQAQLSRILGVAPLTVNRWVKAMREGRDPLEEGSSK